MTYFEELKKTIRDVAGYDDEVALNAVLNGENPVLDQQLEEALEPFRDARKDAMKRIDDKGKLTENVIQDVFSLWANADDSWRDNLLAVPMIVYEGYFATLRDRAHRAKSARKTAACRRNGKTGGKPCVNNWKIVDLWGEADNPKWILDHPKHGRHLAYKDGADLVFVPIRRDQTRQDCPSRESDDHPALRWKQNALHTIMEKAVQ